MPTSSAISLDEHSTVFVDSQLREGRYDTASEVVRAGLRLLEEKEAEAKALEAALIAGERSGEPATFDSEAFLRRMRESHGG